MAITIKVYCTNCETLLGTLEELEQIERCKECGNIVNTYYVTPPGRNIDPVAHCVDCSEPIEYCNCKK